jgi:hypothetical protein
MDVPTTKPVSKRKLRPIGVLLFTGAYFLLALLSLARLVTTGIYREQLRYEGWLTAWDSAWGPCLTALSLATLVASVAAFKGLRRGRIGLLAVLGIWTAVFAWGTYFETYMLFREMPNAADALRYPGFWWEQSFPIRCLIWLVFNYWYFFGKRTRCFYSENGAE